ncbi:MAG: hypothetical protein A2020_13735 [Lentisphaerae bacterium GWF2_45_14]|nr:MAG: hypothetical protein A2020_13735 [Lentisphaerae bacterium GWF2_45_14]
MAIRLRQIEKSYTEIPELMQRAEEKNIILRKLKMWVSIAIAIFLVILGYYIFLGPISGYVILNANSITVKSTEYGVVEYIASGRLSKEVTRGDVLAKIRVLGGNAAAMDQELARLRLELIKAQINSDTMTSELSSARERMGMEGIRIELALKLAKDGLERGKINLTKASDIFESRKKDMEKAERLWNLEAISKTDYLTVQRMYSQAEADFKNSEVFLKSLQSELDSAEAAMKNFLEFGEKNMKDLEAGSESSKIYIAEVKKNIKTIESMKNGTGEILSEIKSPINGIIMRQFCRKGEFLSISQEIFTIYSPKTIKLLAYVKAKYKKDIRRGQKVKIRMGGKYIQSLVVNVRPELEQPPKEIISYGFLSKENFFLVVELDHSEVPPEMSPGETGKAFFK